MAAAPDLARLARRLVGTSVGIVLSGGGARAFDRIGGVSMGAMIGAQFAMGHDADEIDAICFDEWVRRRPLRDLTIPRHALIRGQRFRAMLHRTWSPDPAAELGRRLLRGRADQAGQGGGVLGEDCPSSHRAAGHINPFGPGSSADL